MSEPIVVITTGGTIDKVYFDAKSEFEVGKSLLSDLLNQAHVTVDVEVRELMRKDSLDLMDADRALICQTVAGLAARRVVITHGTDTMTKTAGVLARLDCGKTIVLTGSYAPARFAMTDAIFNVGMAFGAVQSKPAGVYIAMNGQVFLGAKVRKNRSTMRFEPI